MAVCRLGPTEAAPPWATGPVVSITRTPDELSVVCPAAHVPDDIRAERDWRGWRVAGTLDFAMVGVLASIAAPLAAAGISIFVVSTFDTDYLLVRQDRMTAATNALRLAGIDVSG